MRYLTNLFFAVIYCAIGVWIGLTMHATNPTIADAAQSPAATNTAETRVVEITVKGSGMEELDGYHYTTRPLTDDEKIMVRGLLKLAQMKGGKHLPQKPDEKK